MDTMKSWILATCCLALVTVVSGFSSGAPTTTCTSLAPNAGQHLAGPQSGGAPYTISFGQATYTPGTPLTSKCRS